MRAPSCDYLREEVVTSSVSVIPHNTNVDNCEWLLIQPCAKFLCGDCRYATYNIG